MIKLCFSVVDLMVRLNKKCTSDKMSDGRTALHLAAATNKVEISHCLITVCIFTCGIRFLFYKVYNLSYINILEFL